MSAPIVEKDKHPEGTMPLYIKENSIIPTREVQQKTDEKPLTNLILDTYLDEKANYSFYEDDNNTLDYKESGEFNITNFTVAKKVISREL
ncbi:DUF5110 domain-containing protein [Clostridium estertheticum]|uniref:DUF5110 domain-containing protein n=1 Tax=Clostridium estertheticum TaxID=238834 RepID=UPI001CD13B1E|nr:DUF5110 domain-containing protein [Clostridium estertheticum]MBZ9685998.1 DUF5110 domain-containing protein [Clostridium estertheticum]